jgi:hypothetical protein
MRRMASAIVILLSLAAMVVPQPVQAANLTLTPAQGIVGSDVSIIGISAYGTGEYQIYWGDERQLIAQGTTSGVANVLFTVPESSRGKRRVLLKIGANAYDGEFNVLPSIRINVKEGYVASDLVVTGAGFNSNESGIEITYSGTAIVSGVMADSKGNWQSTFKIPPSRSGVQIIDAGGTTPATEVDNRNFTVIPKIDINPVAGGVGTMVTVYGTGFGASESGITIGYDGLKVKTAIASDIRGSWQSNFFVPSSTKGRHRVNSYGEVTGEANVTSAGFTVSPALKLELASGQLGDVIRVGDDFWVSGIGFEQNEGGVQVMFDGVMIASGTVADANGSWAVPLKVPPTTRGKHVVNAAGNTTKSGDVAGSNLIVSPQIEINPTTGGVGSDVVVKGTGFSGAQVFTISYDGVQVASGAIVDSKGGLSASFKVPRGKSGGDHTITVTDAMAAVSSATFKTETQPPPVPRAVSPEAGSKLGFLGNTVVTFVWTAVEDPSGVSYILEISNGPEFSGAMLRKDSLTKAQYMLTKDEALQDGSYYWRVKAVDGVGNESPWTTGQLFKVGGEIWIIPAILAALIILGLIIWRVVVLNRKGWR